MKFEEDQGYFPVFYDSNQRRRLQVTYPLIFHLKDHGESKKRYDTLSKSNLGIKASGQLQAPDGSSYVVEDLWTIIDDNTCELSRKVKVQLKGQSDGFRLLLALATAFPANIGEFEYLIPASLYKHNDTDHDGIEDYHRTYDLSFRDELPAPVVLGYHVADKFYVSLIRSKLPQYDTLITQDQMKERFFVLDTDIGSIGISLDEQLQQVLFKAHYPFFDNSFALTFWGDPWGAFLPNVEGRTVELRYRIRLVDSVSSLSDAWADLFKHLMLLYKPEPAKIPFTLSEGIEYRFQLLDQFYMERNANEDPREPAGFPIFANPETGENLHNILEFGFTGRNLLAAYLYLRRGYEKKDKQYTERARRIIRFFVNNCQLDNGWLNCIYDMDKKSPAYWGIGIVMPFNLAQKDSEIDFEIVKEYFGEDAAKEYLPIFKILRKLKGGFLKSMCESTYELLLCYEIEKQHGIVHKDWLDVAIKFAEFLLGRQNPNGSWYRQYDIDGNPIIFPEKWFGSNDHEWKSTTAEAILPLIKLYELAGDRRYLEAAIRAGNFVLNKYVKTAEMLGVLEETSHIKNTKIDMGSTVVALQGLLYLYEITKDIKYLDGALDAARFYSSWIYIWDVPFPEGTKLHKYGFRTTGSGGVDVIPGGAAIDSYSEFWICDLLRLASLTKERNLFTLAELVQFGVQQMVATPQNLHGYKHVGTREEIYMVGYLLAASGKKPKYSGGICKMKGEGTGTFYLWIPLANLYNLYRIRDEFGTLDYQELRKKIIG